MRRFAHWVLCGRDVADELAELRDRRVADARTIQMLRQDLHDLRVLYLNLRNENP